jgi:hypothetical protein
VWVSTAETETKRNKTKNRTDMPEHPSASIIAFSLILPLIIFMV